MAWRTPDVLDAVLGRVASRVLPGADLRPPSLAPDVRALSDLYNGLEAPRVHPDRALAARLLFFVPADLGKVPTCVAELRAASRLPTGRSLRVLDLGAGLGTASVALRLALRGPMESLEVVAVDRDARALEIGRLLHEEIDRALAGDCISATYRALARDLVAGNVPEGPFDLVVVQGLLSEMPEEAHEPLLVAALGTLAPTGVAIVVEPALRRTSRALHRLRDSLIARRAARVFAPCVRLGPCPALERESDWCHEDRPWSPSTRVADLARRASLRRAGLKYSYVTLLADEASVASTLPAGGDAYRVVSEAIESKGKTEVFLCGDGGRLRVSLLKRERTPDNADFRQLQRGDLVRVAGLDPARPRLGPTSRVLRCTLHR